MNNNVFLSVLVITYKHKEFLTKCIDSVIAQNTTFNFEILVGIEFDDLESIDYIPINNQSKAILNYIISSKENLIYLDNKRTGRGNFINILNKSKGKYIALCEGDDYWTDPYKLQKQVDFLEANPDFNLCFTKSNQLINGDKLELKKIPDISSDGIYTYDDLLKHYNFITTASVVFRKNFNNIPSWIYQLPYGDMGLYCLVSRDAKIKCLPEISSVYRVHNNGIWSGINELKQLENELIFNQIIFNQLTKQQQLIIQGKQKTLISGLSYRIHKKNRLFRLLKRIQLTLKYKL